MYTAESTIFGPEEGSGVRYAGGSVGAPCSKEYGTSTARTGVFGGVELRLCVNST